MNHLTSDELIDAAEGSLAPELRVHLERCAACRDESVRLRTMLDGLTTVDVPEPSPLFWDHFATRVRAAITREPAPERRWFPQWLRWQVLAPIAALGLLVVALSSTIARAPTPPKSTDTASMGAAEGDLTTLGEAEWAVVVEIVGPVEIDEARAAGIAANPGDADRIALQLSADEQRELVRLIKEEMDKAGD